MLLKVKRTLPA